MQSRKRRIRRKTDLNRSDDTIQAYRAANKKIKTIVKAKIEAYHDLYNSLDSKDGQKTWQFE